MGTINHLIKFHNRKIQKILFYIILSGLSIHFIRMAFLAEGVFEPGDGINHFTIAKNAPQFPILYLDHWGKPLFTLLSSPFAQIGFEGMIIFNVLLFIITSYSIFKWALIRVNPFAWLTPLLLISSPIYFEMVNAGMTEILFAALLTTTISLYLNEKYILGSILISFSFFSRPEGIIVLPILVLYLIWKKKWTAIPLLSFGFILYAIIGYFYFNDFLWYLNNNPYPLYVPFYAHGELLSFVKAYRAIWGPFLTLSSVLGIILVLTGLLGSKRVKAIEYSLLLILPAGAVFFVHSYIWWKGIHGSLGLVRVISTVIPLFVIISLIFLKFIQKKIKQKLLFSYSNSVSIGGITIFVLSILLYSVNKRLLKLPIQESAIQETISESANWFVAQNFEGKIYFMDPYFAYKANLNPYEVDQTGLLYSVDKENPALHLNKNDIIVWDSHFGPADGGISKEKLIQSKQLEIIKIFKPKDPNTRIKGNSYEIIISVVK